jgi:hypothetical protein
MYYARRKKGQDIQMEMVLSSRSRKRYCEIPYSILTSRWLEDILSVYEREIYKLYRKYIRVCSERRLYDSG